MKPSPFRWWSYGRGGTLSIPLRMKRLGSTQSLLRLVYFQFLWGWNRITSLGRFEFKVYYFQFLWGWNTFATRIVVYPSTSFQFLWGWNMGSVLVVISTAYRFFQFLWGWNLYGVGVEDGVEETLSIPLRMKLLLFTLFNLVFKKLSIPLRMKLRKEDDKETVEKRFQFLWGWN